MAATSNPDFDHSTEAIEVAEYFADNVRGKTILITGINRDGIGFSTAQALAPQSPARLILASRSPEKIQACIDLLRPSFPDIDYRSLQLNLSSQASVRGAAATVLAWDDVPKLDLLINSAGVMCIPERTLSPEGIEMHLATNHIGHFLLTNLLMPKLIAAAQHQPAGMVRVVNVTSASPKISGFRWSDINFTTVNKDLPEQEQPNYDWFSAWGYDDLREAAYNPLDGYTRSKVANVLFSIGANARLFSKHGILSAAVHPGVVLTELSRSFPPDTMENVRMMMEKGVIRVKTLGAGGATSLVAALDPGLAKGVGETREGSENWGAYLEDCQVSGSACNLAVSSSEAEGLWKLSEQLVGEEFAW